MAVSIGSSMDRVKNMRVMDLPVGNWFLFSVANGIASAAITAGKVFSPDYGVYVTGPALATLVKKVSLLRNFFGESFSEILAIMAGSATLDHPDVLDLSKRVRGYVADGAQALNLISAEQRAEFEGTLAEVSRAIAPLAQVPRVTEIPDRAPAPRIPMSAPDLGRIQSIRPGRGYSEVAKRTYRIRV